MKPKFLGLETGTLFPSVKPDNNHQNFTFRLPPEQKKLPEKPQIRDRYD